MDGLEKIAVVVKELDGAGVGKPNRADLFELEPSARMIPVTQQRRFLDFGPVDLWRTQSG
jgi:hypothetical protein